MGNRTKASRARLTNLSKALEKSYKATVKDHSDTDDLDYTPDSDMEDLGSEGSEFDEADITDDAALLTFANVLQLAQEAGLEAEQKAQESKKCRKHYKGNSEQSLRWFHANRRAIAAVGKQGFISSWLTASTTNAEAYPTPTLTSVSQYIFYLTDKAHYK